MLTYTEFFLQFDYFLSPTCLFAENKKKKEMISLLVHRGYDSDPVKMWKEAQNKLAAEAEGTDNEEDAMSEISSASSGAGHDYNYLLGMALWSLTREKKDDLLKNRDEKVGFLKKKLFNDTCS